MDGTLAPCFTWAAVDGIGDRSAVDLRNLVQAVLERRDDPEVSATAAQSPEQILVLLIAGHDNLPVGGDDLGRDEVVARQPVLARQVADAATKRQPRDAGRPDDPTGGGQAVGVGP